MQCKQASIELEKPNFHFLVLMGGGGYLIGLVKSNRQIHVTHLCVFLFITPLPYHLELMVSKPLLICYLFMFLHHTSLPFKGFNK
jgi:hypothetical protein